MGKIGLNRREILNFLRLDVELEYIDCIGYLLVLDRRYRDKSLQARISVKSLNFGWGFLLSKDIVLAPKKIRKIHLLINTKITFLSSTTISDQNQIRAKPRAINNNLKLVPVIIK